jgi:very-short-patch-repair endonuclease
VAVDKTLARALRKSATPAEKVLWERLRGRQLVNLKFLRQVPIGPFVADFCCRDRRLIVELDGEIHDGDQQTARDHGRDAYLQGQDYVVLRFPNEQVFSDIESVLREICDVTLMAKPHWNRSSVSKSKAQPSSRSPSSPGEGGAEGAGEEGRGDEGLGWGRSG